MDRISVSLCAASTQENLSDTWTVFIICCTEMLIFCSHRRAQWRRSLGSVVAVKWHFGVVNWRKLAWACYLTMKTTLGNNFRFFKMTAFVKGPKSAKFYTTNHIAPRHLNPVHLIWAKFGLDILLDIRKQPAEFFISLKI